MLERWSIRGGRFEMDVGIREEVGPRLGFAIAKWAVTAMTSRL